MPLFWRSLPNCASFADLSGAVHDDLRQIEEVR